MNRFPSLSALAPVPALALAMALAVPVRAEFTLPAGKAVPLLWNRTPRIFSTDPPPPASPMRANARAEVSGDTLRVTLSWSDPTEDAVEGAARVAYGKGTIYRKPTERTDRFGDAAAMMVPARAGEPFPAIMMGEPDREVRIVLWRAGTGVETLHGRGRGTVERAPGDGGLSASHRRIGALREVTFTMKGYAEGLPVSFAIWDGAGGDRNGYKWYTPWYRLFR
ncbi:MAG: hypothetical protein OHK0028_07250 [Deltaproteobacteria bacterium]